MFHADQKQGPINFYNLESLGPPAKTNTLMCKIKGVRGIFREIRPADKIFLIFLPQIDSLLPF